MSIDPATGVISGTAAASGTYTVAVTATNSAGQGTATLTLTVVAPAFAVTTTPVAFSARVGQAFTTTLTNSGNSASNSTATSLPPGLSINATTGVISGTPTTAGSYNATTTQTSEYGTVTGHITFVVGTAAPTTPVFTSPGGLGGYVDTPFSYRLQATGSPTSFGIYTALPSGLSLDASTGTISGTPTAAGTYVLNVYAGNGGGVSQYSTLVMTIGAVTAAPLQVTSMAGMWWTANSPSLKYPVTANLPLFSTTAATNLPPGLSFSTASNGTISGTPTTAGRYDVTLTLTNGYTGAVSSAVVNFRIDAADPIWPQLFSSPTASGTVGSSFAYTVSAIDSVAAVTASSLPSGLSFSSSSGAISGVPTTAGTYQIPVSATNANGTRTGTLTLVIAGPPIPSLAASTNPLERAFTVGTASGTSNAWYIYATGSPTSYAAYGLPPGLSVNTTTGQITGTLTTAGTYPATVSVTNATGSASAVITYVVSPATVGPPVIPYLDANLTAFVGVPISTVSLSATNTPTAYAASGLPSGLTLNPANGQITGAPTVAGTYTVNLSAANSAGTGTAVWTVLVNNPSVLSPAFSTAPAEFGGKVSRSAYCEFEAYAYYGGSETNVATSITVSGLPAGMQISDSEADYIEIGGTPTTAGTYPLTLTATVPGGASTTTTCLFVVSPAPAPTITSAAGVLGNVNNPFSYNLYASNTVTSYSAGTLPAGLMLNSSTGQISGTPTTAGTTVVPVSASGPYGAASAVVTIRVDPPLYGGLPVITSAATINSQNFVTAGGYYRLYYPSSGSPTLNSRLAALNGPVTFTLSNLPAGLVFNPYTSLISGQPVAAGVFQVPITATNSVGTISATLTIVSGAPLAIAAPPLAQSGYVGGEYSGSLPAYYPALGTYGETSLEPYPFYYYEEVVEVNPVTFTASGLPSGLSLNGDEGTITGTFAQAGTYPVTLTTSSLSGTSSAVCTFAVAASAPASTGATTAPTFNGQAQAAGFVGVPLSYYLYGSGASSYASDTLPAGLALNPATGQITGTPTTVGVYPVAVSATNAAGTTPATLTVTVDAAPPAPVLESECAAIATVGTAFYYYIDAYGPYSGLPAVTSYAASGLPTGLSMNTSTGEITGTPAGPAGVYTVPVTAFVGPVTTLGGTLTLTVQSPPAVAALPVMSSTAGALGLVGNPFSYAVYNAAFVPAAGSLPAGLSYDAATGIIGGYPTTPGTYVVPLTATVTSGGGNTSLSSVLTVGVFAPDSSLPRLTTQPGGGTATEGSSFTFTVAATGAPAPVYQWYHNGTAVGGASNAMLTLSALAPTDSGNYAVTATNAAGGVTSSTVTLLVLTTYGQWQTDHFTAQEIAAGSAGDSVSFSGDGISNLLKYALDLDPRHPLDGALPVVGSRSAANGLLEFAFNRDTGETDINYLVEASSDLLAWTTVAQSVAGASTVGLSGSEGVTETAIAGTSQRRVTVEAAPSTSGSQFLRLRVTRP